MLKRHADLRMRMQLKLFMVPTVAPMASSPGCRQEHKSMSSVEGGHLQVEELISRGVDANIASSFGMTALHVAAMMDQPTVISVLLEAGAHLDKRAQDGSTSLHIACQENSIGAAAILLRNVIGMHKIGRHLSVASLS
eukprot:jgi/Ulvmu1/5276/UM022_0070.1